LDDSSQFAMQMKISKIDDSSKSRSVWPRKLQTVAVHPFYFGFYGQNGRQRFAKIQKYFFVLLVSLCTKSEKII
jgi:hypothetical protein